MGVTTPMQATSAARAAHRQQVAGPGLEAHVEEQQDGAQLGQHGERLAPAKAVEPRAAQQRQVPEGDAEGELRQHGGLAPPREELARELRADEDHRQAQQDDGRGSAVARPGCECVEHAQRPPPRSTRPPRDPKREPASDR
jgi:hypothetical protein